MFQSVSFKSTTKLYNQVLDHATLITYLKHMKQNRRQKMFPELIVRVPFDTSCDCSVFQVTFRNHPDQSISCWDLTKG